MQKSAGLCAVEPHRGGPFVLALSLVLHRVTDASSFSNMKSNVVRDLTRVYQALADASVQDRAHLSQTVASGYSRLRNRSALVLMQPEAPLSASSCEAK